VQALDDPRNKRRIETRLEHVVGLLFREFAVTVSVSLDKKLETSICRGC